MAGVNFLPIQAGTGDPSPTNVRPITPGLSITGIGDIYGGYLDVANGVVVEIWSPFVVDGSKQVASVVYHQNSGNYYTTIETHLDSFNTTASTPHLISDKFKAYNGVIVGDCYITAAGKVLIAVLLDQTATTKELVMKWFESNPTLFVYELATPIVHPLTTAQLIEAMQKLHVPSAPAQALHRRLANTPHPVTTTPASVASFDTDMVGKLKSAKFGFLPVQDLHGYNNPWPAGGGKNLLNVTATSDTINGVTFTVNPDGTVLVNGTATAEAVFVLNNDVGLESGTYIGSGAPNGTGTSYVIQAKVDGIYKNIFASQQLDVSTGITTVLIDVKSGVNVNNVTLKPMICLSTASEPSTFAPYSNICPISGWDGVTVGQAGKNQLDPNLCLLSSYWNVNQTRPSTNDWLSVDYISVLPNTTYTITGSTITHEGPTAQHLFYNGNKKLISTITAGTTNQTFTTPNECKFVRLSIKNSSLDGLQLELGSTATPYTPYTGSTYPVTWQSEAGTIYGGYVDVCKGVVVAEWVSCSFEGDVCSTLWYDADSGRDTLGFYREARVWSFIDYPTPVDGGGIFDYCKVGAVYNENTPWVARFLFMNGSFNRFEMRIPKSVLADITSESAAKQSVVSYLDAHPLQAVYRIEPITYSITPTIIKTLRGANNMWSNANGNAEATYWTHGRVIPYEYQRVEYLESSGSQYIVTDYVADYSGLLVEFEFEIHKDSELVGDNVMFGDYGASYGQRLYAEMYKITDGRWYGQCGVGAYRSINSNATSLNTRYIASMTADVLMLNGVSYQPTEQRVSAGLNRQLYIFAWNNNGTAQYKHEALRLYKLTMKNSGTISANFIPCVRKSDSKPGMYDTVSKTFYTNAGSGEFIVPA